MDPQASPPKRMTRARAAAKATESSVKPTKIVTAAAKAKATRAASATATKRKTRADDVDDEDEDELRQSEPEQPLKSAMKPATRATRGRPKKVAEPEPESAPAPVRATRGRPPKKAAPEPVKEEPVRATRTRAKKAQVDEEEADEINAEPVKKTTRGRAATTTTKPAVKKTVKFEEPDKENVAPPAVAAKGKSAAKATETTTGLRGRPVRKAAPATRATRTTKASAAEKKDNKAPTPLSPKKVTQMPVSRDSDSEDELGATPRASYKSLMKSPVKPAMGTHAPKLAPEPAAASTEEENTTTTAKALDAAPSIILGSPIRRPAPSPFKDAMKSPARRVEGIPSLALSSTTKSGNNTSQSPHKASLLLSPAKRPAGSPMKSLGVPPSGHRDQSRSPMKLSLLQASAKRPASPVKNAIAHKAAAPIMLSTPMPPADASEEAKGLEESMDEVDMALNGMDAEMMPDSPTRLRFPGRLSAVLPRHADPVLNEAMLTVPESAEDEDEVDGLIVESNAEEIDEVAECLGDPMEVDEPEVDQPGSTSTTPPHSPPKHSLGMFGLRQKDIAPYDEVSESEDELASSILRSGPSSSAVMGTPCPASSKSSRSRASNAFSKKIRTSNFGFTPLAKQLSEWTGASPLKTGSQDQTVHLAEQSEDAAGHESPMKNTFFEDEMSVRPEPPAEGSVTPEVEEPVFDEIPVIEEDMALAAEANEMSLMEPDQVEDMLNLDTPDDSMSEASQEYGDENAVPIDPALQQGSDPLVPPVTPKRMVMREFHTVSKVPLKAADNSTPRPVLKKRSHSISRLPVQRPTQGLTRSATVISYSPMKKRRESTVFDAPEEEEPQRAGSAPPVTPTKSEVGWSTAGTPARTPRRDVNPALLSGAVVFVDVHTSEGADASGIFVELLSQMGARCVKSWPWNPSSPPSKDSGASGAHKVGITHVVFKDGGKRTLEKVRESDGVVQCVGVSWVLDCERENEWLEEAPYYIDTTMVPRGGHRRRKSMEPRAFANLNGMLVPTPVKNASNGAARQSQSLPATPVNRRDSALWMHTPEDEDNENVQEAGIHEDEWDVAEMLTPVPVTPAPEAIARFALDVTPETPSTDVDDVDSVVAKEMLITRTCPPKASACQELGEGILSREKDQNVMMRLMAARRKSLQFAPKIGSPLSKAWN